MTDKTVLVTGGAGYVGSHACKALAGAGYTPVVYDNLSRGHRWAVRWGPLEEGDINDRERLATVFKAHKPAAVLHFAAFAYVGESVQDPNKYYRNNVAGTLNLLDAMLAAKVDRMVFSSTCAIYGVPDSVPIKEDHVQRPVSAYGKTKLVIEHALQDFSRAYGMRTCALRYFNAAGADPDGEIGELHEPETHLIPLVLQAAGRQTRVSIFGDDYDTPDGTCIRDYIHVTDLADAHVLALKHLDAATAPQHYNLGNGAGYSVREVIETAREVTGKHVNTCIDARRPGDPPRLVGDATRAMVELGWRPKYAGLADMIESAWRWMNLQAARGEPVLRAQ